MEHSFDIELAKEYGILEAILMNNLYFWIKKNKANQTNYYDGDYWTYNSVRAFSELFPYASSKKIQRALEHLKDEEIIKTGNYNKVAYDRTLWYAFTEKGKSIMLKCPIDLPKKENGSCQKEKPIPNNKPNKKTYIYYGEYKNVFFTQEQYEKLKEYFPNDYESRIQKLDDYIQSSGKKYKDCLATLKVWARKENYIPPKPKKELKESTITEEEYFNRLKGI